MTDRDHDIPDHDIPDELNRFRPRPISEALRQRIREDAIAGGAARPLSARSPRRHRRLIAVITAAACLAVAIGLWAYWAAGPPEEERGPGPRRGLRLAAGCRLEPLGPVDYEVIGPRRVRLGRGEVYLAVAPAPDAGPFVVETAAAEVRADAACCYVSSGWTDGSPAAIPINGTEGGQEMIRSTANPRLLTTVLVVAGVAQLISPQGSVTGSQGELLAAEPKAPPWKHVEDLTAKFGRFYQPVPIDVKPSIPAYALPLVPGKVANWEHVVGELNLTGAALGKLKANGFVVVPRFGDDIIDPYETIEELKIPPFVTVDTLLHMYHLQFDESLKNIEQREFYPDLLALARMMVDRLGATEAALLEKKLTAAGALDLEAVHKARVYAAVGLKCLDPEWAVPAPIAPEVALVVDKIEKHEGSWGSEQWPLFRYAEDFSHYVPRGHYTQSPELGHYFKAMMWFGRMAFLLKGEEPSLVSPREAQLQTMAAAHLAKLLAGGRLADGRDARALWQRIYTVTAFYVGLADDLGLAEYEASMKKVLGASIDVAALADAGKYRRLQAELARYNPPAIYGGTGGQVPFQADPDWFVQTLDKTTGFRLMGRRFTPDSYAMGKLVFPTVGRPNNNRTDMFTFVNSPFAGPIRGFPRGLDLMALLGSHRAEHWLAELGDDAYGTGTDLSKGKNLRYDVVLEGLKREFAPLTPGQWNRNIYWSWLYTLQSLLKDYGRGYPTFMTTDAWQDKSMNTALASWSQLRHDTILYAKQGVTPGEPGITKPVEGYVEPAAEFYARLLATTRMTLAGLRAMDVLEPAAIERLAKLEKMIARILRISQEELVHKELSKEDYDFIRHFGTRLKWLRAGERALLEELAKARAAGDQQRVDQLGLQLYGDPPPMKTTLIADVHTDQNTGQCLEEGTGNVDLLVACYLQPDGRLVLGAGAVLSYYEFKHPASDRLTDEKWRKLLKTAPPPLPEWTAGYRLALGIGD